MASAKCSRFQISAEVDKDALHDAGDSGWIRKRRSGQDARSGGGGEDAEVQRVAAEGGGAAGFEWAATVVGWGADLVRGREADRDGWAFSGSEGSDRRVLDDSG